MHAISVGTFGSVFIRKCVAPIRATLWSRETPYNNPLGASVSRVVYFQWFMASLFCCFGPFENQMIFGKVLGRLTAGILSRPKHPHIDAQNKRPPEGGLLES